MSVDLVAQTCTIANGTSLSGAINLPADHYPVAILIPAAWTAAALSFQGSGDQSAFGDAFNNAGEITVASASVAANRFISLDPMWLSGCAALKVRSGLTGAAVNQGADRILTVYSRPVR